MIPATLCGKAYITFASTQKGAMGGLGTNLPTRHVRSLVAMG